VTDAYRFYDTLKDVISSVASGYSRVSVKSFKYEDPAQATIALEVYFQDTYLPFLKLDFRVSSHSLLIKVYCPGTNPCPAVFYRLFERIQNSFDETFLDYLESSQVVVSYNSSHNLWNEASAALSILLDYQDVNITQTLINWIESIFHTLEFQSIVLAAPTKRWTDLADSHFLSRLDPIGISLPSFHCYTRKVDKTDSLLEAVFTLERYSTMSRSVVSFGLQLDTKQVIDNSRGFSWERKTMKIVPTSRRRYYKAELPLVEAYEFTLSVELSSSSFMTACRKISQSFRVLSDVATDAVLPECHNSARFRSTLFKTAYILVPKRPNKPGSGYTFLGTHHISYSALEDAIQDVAAIHVADNGQYYFLDKETSKTLTLTIPEFSIPGLKKEHQRWLNTLASRICPLLENK